MKVELKTLSLVFRKSRESIALSHVSYFWGKIGAGKSSIARLIDFCLGANIQLTPALQQEFVSAQLDLVVGNTALTIFRERESPKVVAEWSDGADVLHVSIPARSGAGVVLPGTNVEVLSDLLFHLAGIEIPMVRKGRGGGEQRLERLSFRDLFRFCYLDQDDMDSDFFRLDMQANFAMRQKSVDAIRFVMGYHQDAVASLEVKLQGIHEERMAATAAAEALSKVLQDAGFANPADIDARIQLLQTELAEAIVASASARTDANPKTHAVDDLRARGRVLASELEVLENSVRDIDVRLSDLERHDNELKMLSVRFERTASARAVLEGVDFSRCPRCTKTLPVRDEEVCSVCGRPENEPDDTQPSLDDELVKADLVARLTELREAIARMKSERVRIARSLVEVRARKSATDAELTARLRQYDSAFMSRALEYERQVTALEQQIGALSQYRKLPDLLREQFATSDTLMGRESEIRAKLSREREAAFKDRSNLELLERLFLDSLVKAAFPGVTSSSFVSISPTDFVPTVSPTAAADFSVTSFANMGSGGMKSIFKSCFALALHRLAQQTGACLPTILILDSPMKNISERENKELFEAFFRLVYDLAAGELKESQFIIIDKEFCPVPKEIDVKVFQRHMAPGSSTESPLIPYFQVQAIE